MLMFGAFIIDAVVTGIGAAERPSCVKYVVDSTARFESDRRTLDQVMVGVWAPASRNSNTTSHLRNRAEKNVVRKTSSVGWTS